MSVTTKDVSPRASSSKQFVVIKDGKEVGVIVRHGARSAWAIYRGVGAGAEYLGTNYSKARAIAAAARLAKPLEQLFDECHPDFKKEITKLAEENGRTVLTVYQWWREYSTANFDQSALLSEFTSGYLQHKLDESDKKLIEMAFAGQYR